MSIETVAAILFLLFLTLFLIKNKKKIEIQKILWPLLYFAMYRTKLGLKKMDLWAKKLEEFSEHTAVIRTLGVLILIYVIYLLYVIYVAFQIPELVGSFDTSVILQLTAYLTLAIMAVLVLIKPKEWLSIATITTGIAGMLLICGTLIYSLFKLILVPSAAPEAALVLPFKVSGMFYVPFFYWIVSIFIIAAIHEFCHGILSRMYKVPIKSSGFAFLGLIIPVIPAAFVEPDEKILAKKSRKEKMSVFAAGPFANIISAYVFLIILLFMTAIVAPFLLQSNGVLVEGFSPNSSSQAAGMPSNVTITEVNGIQVLSISNLSQALKDTKVNQVVDVKTTNGTYNVTLGPNPKNSSLPYLGVLVRDSTRVNPAFEAKYGSFVTKSLSWILGLLNWLIILSLGIGIFNLIPVGPIDGGLFSKEIFTWIFRKEKTAMRVWYWISMIFLGIILINLLAGFF